MEEREEIEMGNGADQQIGGVDAVAILEQPIRSCSHTNYQLRSAPSPGMSGAKPW